MNPADLRDPQTWASDEVTVRETHLSWVVLAGDLAYKIKKPVRMSFVDFRTLEARRDACEAEVRLNRRLAPAVYLGVRRLVRRADGGLVLADDGDAVDFVVVMKRFDERDTLASRIADDRVTEVDARMLGGQIAEFHRDLPRRTDAGAARRMKAALDETFSDLFELAPGHRRRVLRLHRFVSAYLASRWDLFETRGSHGLVREGHGDLRAEHVVMAETTQVVDCVEFSEDLRTIDVAQDVAFLVMELEQLGRPDLAEAFVRGYRTAGGNAAVEDVLAFFAVGRALVRAKVAFLCAAQEGRRESAAADGLLAVAERLAWRARGTLALVICGPAASGKSTLAGALQAESGCCIVSSDVIRKRAAGLEPHERGGPALYTAAHDAATYSALVGDMSTQLAWGSVIVDATFRDGRRRAAVELATGRAHGRLIVLECRMPVDGIFARARAREHELSRISDADRAVTAEHLAAWRSWDAERSVVVRTDKPIDRQLASVTDALDAWL